MCVVPDPPHPDQPEYEAMKLEHLNRIVTACNVHKHTQTCYKYGYKNCRFEFERPAVEVSKIEKGVVFLQRKKGNGFVNNYNDVFALVLRCNHDIKFICNGNDSKSLSFYITDYITKKAMTTHNAFPLIIAAQKEIEMNIHPCRPNPLYTPAQQQNRDLVVKCLNKLTTHSERSGPEVSTLLLDKPLHYTSDLFSKAFVTSFVRDADTIDAISTQSDSDSDDDHPEKHSGENYSLSQSHDKKTFSLTNQRVDYTLRSSTSKVSLYDFAAKYYKVLKPKKKIPPTAICFDIEHPQHSTHCMVKYVNPYTYRIPVIVGRQFPSKKKCPEQYYKLFLILFKPFHSVSELKTESTWELSFGSWWTNDLTDTQREDLDVYEKNIYAISSGTTQQKEEKEARRKLREEQGLIDKDEQTKFSTFDPFEPLMSRPDAHSLNTPMDGSDLTLPKADPKKTLGMFALNALLSMTKHNGFANHNNNLNDDDNMEVTPSNLNPHVITKQHDSFALLGSDEKQK